MFPVFASGNNIRSLDLGDTDIREVPSSVELLKKIKMLYMRGCHKLSIISTNICKLKSLSDLDLRSCTNLESFPEILEPMESLTSLDLSGCTKLKGLPNDQSFHNLKSLKYLHLDETAITGLPSSIQHLTCLERLDIFGCQNLTSLPSFIHNLTTLTKIIARNLGIVDLPESLKQLPQLLELDVGGCSNLCSLPELPSSLVSLNANGCVSLKTISSACFASERKNRTLIFANCLNWDEEERERLLNIAISNLLYTGIPMDRKFEIMLPWSEIPEWFCGSKSIGSS